MSNPGDPRSTDPVRAAAKLAVARLPRAPGKGDLVELRLILALDRAVAERLAARAIGAEKNLAQFVLQIVEEAAAGRYDSGAVRALPLRVRLVSAR